MSQFGTLVRRLRLEKGLTLDEVAESVDSYKSYVWQIETGRVNPPSVKFIHRYARLFRWDAREMVRLAYLDKAPGEIRAQLHQQFQPLGTRRGPAGSSVTIPLLNTVEDPYPTALDAAGRPEPVLRAEMLLPGLDPAIGCALTLRDASMESPESPSYGRGAVILLRTPCEVETGRVAFVVHGVRKERAATFRLVARLRGSDLFLEALNAKFPTERVPLKDILAFLPAVGPLGEVMRRERPPTTQA